MVRRSRIKFGIAGALVLLFVAARLRYPGNAPVRLPAENCDSELWKHVYDKERLRVLEACTAVEGRVKSMWRESDGDLHIALDPDNKSVLSIFNLAHAHRTLVVEVICEHTPSGDAAKAACGDRRQQLAIPNIGDRVRVTGTFAVDKDNSWTEIHPVTRIEVLR
jgi:hypothetical protein